MPLALASPPALLKPHHAVLLRNGYRFGLAPLAIDIVIQRNFITHFFEECLPYTGTLFVDGVLGGIHQLIYALFDGNLVAPIGNRPIQFGQFIANWILTGYGNMLLPERTYSSEEEQTVMESEAYKKLAKEIEELKGKIGDNIVIGDSAQGNYVKNDMAKTECLLCLEKEKLIDSLKEQIRAKDELIRVLMGGKDKN